MNGKRQLLLPIAVLASRDPNDISYVECSALLDTGATTSGIGPRAIDKLELRSHQKKPLSVATELRMVDYYLFRLGFIRENTEVSGGLPLYIFAETDGFSWSEDKNFDVILGMDVLSQCDFKMKKNGQWELDFGN